MKKIWILLLLAVAVPAEAQTTAGAYGIADLGVAATPVGFLGMASGGVQYGRWSWGLATGYDAEGVKSLPVLSEARWRITHTLEIFHQQGLNAVVQKGKDPSTGLPLSYGPGVYLRGGLAWRLVQTKHAGGLWISAGYRYKTHKEEAPLVYRVYIPTYLGGQPYIWYPSYNPHLREWAGTLTIGWRW